MRSIILLIFVVICLTACERNQVFEKNTGIKGHEWSHTDKIPFTVEIQDTAATYDLYVNVRHSTSYNFTNLYLNIHTFYPSGKKGTLTKRVELGSNDELKWLGECLNDICYRQAEIIKGMKFPERGEYKFLVEQIMRTDPLPDIMSVGLRVEKHNYDK